MTGEILLDNATSERVHEISVEFAADLRLLIGPTLPPDPATADIFVASVGVQAFLRGLYDEEQPERLQSMLAGGGEGIGMILGLIEDVTMRRTVFQQCVQAMHTGMQLQARIHTTAGEA